MSAHTPGPWAVHPITAQVDGFATGEPVPICRLLWPTVLRSEDETQANGYLIAKAPEMLEMLRDFAGDGIGHMDTVDAVRALLAEIDGGTE